MYNRGSYSLRKTADILRLHQRFPREKRTEERALKFHIDDLIWVVLLIGRSKFPSQHVQSKTLLGYACHSQLSLRQTALGQLL